MNTLVVLLLITGIVCVTISWFKRDLQCPPPTVIYRYVPANTLDTQFSKENLPSNLYSDMFNNDNLWIGGMSMSMGKTPGLSIPKDNSAPVPFMSMTPTPIPDQPILSGPNTGPQGL